jgi:vitamin B12 transporter
MLKLIGSLSTAFNAPTLAQRFDPVSGNADLKAETARSVEAGIQYMVQGSMLRFATFYTKTTNQFAPSPTLCNYAANICPTVNLNSSHNKGVEVSGTYRVGATTLRGSLTVQDPIDDSTGETLFRRVKQFGSLAVTHADGPWQWGADMTFSGRHGDLYFFNTSPYSEDKTVAGYGKLNLVARRQVSKEVSVYVRIVNALDREYQTVYGYNQLPRSVYVGLNWQL